MFTQPLVIGSTYRLKFKTTFERHGVCTTPGVTCLHSGGGVFRLEQITNFRDLVLAGIKLYDVFFKPLGISEEQYRKYFDGKPEDELTPEYTTSTVDNETEERESKTDVDGNLVVVTKRTVTRHEVHVETGRSLLKKHYRDNVNYASYPLYKFVDVTDSNDILYVPELTIEEFPEIDIREYKDLSLVVHLGYTHDPTTLDPMLLSVRERMAAYGWRPSLIKLYVTDSKWMSPTEYDAVKSLRVPATIETITDETRNDMLGQVAILNGQLKKIVEPTTINKNYKWMSEVSNPEEEVSIDALQKQDAIIDNRLFLVKCQDGEVYVTGDNYYIEIPKDSSKYYQTETSDFADDGEFKSGTKYYVYNKTSRQYEEKTDASRYITVTYATRDPDVVYYVNKSSTDTTKRVATTDDFDAGQFRSGTTYFTRSETKYYVSKSVSVVCRKKLVEGLDYNPGEPCVQYRLATAADDSLQHYHLVVGGYNEVAYGHHGDYSAEVLVRKLFVKVYEETTDATRDTSKTYYMRDSESVYRVAVDSDFKSDGSFDLSKVYYEYQGETESYRAATEEEIADPSQVLYVKQSDTYKMTSDKTIGSTYVRVFELTDGTSYSTVLKESYSTLEALSLMGYKFDYSDVFGNSKTMTLQLEDIIETADQESNVVLPDASFDYDTFWKRFDNRIFRYTNYPDPNDPTVTETIDITISEETVALLSLKAGRLLGQSGQISKETYVKDSDQQKRNYYMRYVIQQKSLEDKKARVEVLEQALIEQQAICDKRVAELEEEIAEKDARIAELEEQLPT